VPDRAPAAARRPGHTDAPLFQETGAATAETNPIDLQDMATEQTACPETKHLIASGSSLKIEFQDMQGTGSQGTHRQACGDRWYPQNTARQCSITSTTLPTEADLRHRLGKGVCCLSAVKDPSTFSGPTEADPVPQHHLAPTSTWGAPSHPPMVLITF
jgi:hypothetical protein